jgi:hypothetical protein
MNKLIGSLTLALAVIAVCPASARAAAGLESDPAYLPIDKAVDLKAFPPEVNINLPRFLLRDFATDLSRATNGPLADKNMELADLIKDVKLIRLVVIEAGKTNRPALDKAIKALRADLEAKWTTIVSVPEEHVGVYALSDPAGESVAGVAVLVYDDGDAVIGNIVGRVPISKLLQIASKMDKTELLKRLQEIGNQTNAPAAAESK